MQWQHLIKRIVAEVVKLRCDHVAVFCKGFQQGVVHVVAN